MTSTEFNRAVSLILVLIVSYLGWQLELGNIGTGSSLEPLLIQIAINVVSIASGFWCTEYHKEKLPDLMCAVEMI